jgi:DNA-binding NarL/FixJ family response regulator
MGNSPKRDGEPGLLTEREQEILGFLVERLTNKQIAERLNISPVTVKSHLRHIMDKLDAADRHEAALAAKKRNLI